MNAKGSWSILLYWAISFGVGGGVCFGLRQVLPLTVAALIALAAVVLGWLAADRLSRRLAR